MNKTEKNLERIFKLCLKIFYYYYFVLSILNLCFFYFELYSLLDITTVLILIGIIIELFCGYVRGYLGLIGYALSIILSIYFTSNVWLGLSVGLSIVNILNIIINKIVAKFLTFMIKKFN